MKNLILDEYEQEIENSIAIDLNKNALDFERKKLLKNSVSATLKKDKSISIRLTNTDLQNIKTVAIEKGMPYQTLISSIIHQVATKQINIVG
jgi:predicted DNA binding CopG/RHH family protein